MTIAGAQEALAIVARIKSIRAARADAQRICQANAHGSNGAGLTIKLSDPIVAKIKAMRLAELDAMEAAERRRAAQIDLSLEGL